MVGEARPSCTTDDGRGMATCTCSDWNDASRAKEGEEVGEKKHVHGWWRGVARRSVARRHVLHETTNLDGSHLQMSKCKLLPPTPKRHR